MADNITLNAGTGGATAASDDIGGVHFQRVKMALGADGVHDGDVSLTNPMPVLPLQVQTKTGSISAVNSNLYSGTPSANSTVQFDNILVNTTAVIVQMTGTIATFTAFQPQISIDNDRWYNVQAPQCVQIQGDSGSGLSWSTPNSAFYHSGKGIYKFQTLGFPYFRITCTSYGSGTADFVMKTINETASPNFGYTAPPTNIAQINGSNSYFSQGAAASSSIRTTFGNFASATVASVASSATSVTLLASSASRAGAIFFNDSTQVLYLKFGATASTTSFTRKLAAGEHYELPIPLYSGTIDGIWASADGFCRVTSW